MAGCVCTSPFPHSMNDHLLWKPHSSGSAAVRSPPVFVPNWQWQTYTSSSVCAATASRTPATPMQPIDLDDYSDYSDDDVAVDSPGAPPCAALDTSSGMPSTKLVEDIAEDQNESYAWCRRDFMSKQVPGMITTATTCDGVSSVSSIDTYDDEHSVGVEGAETLLTCKPCDTREKNVSGATKRGRRCLERADGFLRAVRSTLHNLTTETLPESFQQLSTCGVENVDHTRLLIDEIFTNAAAQQHSRDLCADLCVQLNAFFTDAPVDDNPQHSFKRILLKACQNAFERGLSGSRTSGVDSRIADVRCRKLMLGNIRFVGALAVRYMLGGRILISVCHELLWAPTAETLESLAALLTVVGERFDKPSCPHHEQFLEVLNQVVAMSSSALVEPRVQYLLKDVLDLRRSGWTRSQIPERAPVRSQTMDEAILGKMKPIVIDFVESRH